MSFLNNAEVPEEKRGKKIVVAPSHHLSLVVYLEESSN